MAPSPAKEFFFKGGLQIVHGGACDGFKIGGLLGYKPWRSATDEAAASRDGRENVWLRCRLTSLISIISGLDPYALVGDDFYIPFWFLRQIGNFSLEGQDPNRRGSIEVRVPQVEPARS